MKKGVTNRVRQTKMGRSAFSWLVVLVHILLGFKHTANSLGCFCLLRASGELRVRGPTLFSCYWNRPEATAQAFDEQGYFCTGETALQLLF